MRLDGTESEHEDPERVPLLQGLPVGPSVVLHYRAHVLASDDITEP